MITLSVNIGRVKLNHSSVIAMSHIYLKVNFKILTLNS